MKRNATGASAVAFPSRVGRLLGMVVIGLTPVILAVLSWDTGSTKTPLQNWLRLTGAPVVGVELLIFILAVQRGFEPLKTIRSAPAWVLVALLVLTLIAFANAAFVAPDGLTSAVHSYMALMHILFALGIAHLVAVDAKWGGTALWIVIVAGIGAYLVLLAIFVALIPEPGRFDWLHLGLGVINIRHVGFFAAVGSAAALGLAAGAASVRA